MIRLRSRSGHVLTVADEAAAAFWEDRGYRPVKDAPAEPKPAKKATAKKAAPKKDSE